MPIKDPEKLKEWRKKNAKRLKEWQKSFHVKHPEKRKEYNERYKAKDPDKYRAEQNARQKKRRQLPWIKTSETIRRRLRQAKAGRKRDLAYANVTMHLTPSDLKELWFRDNAAGLKHPSIDRIDPDGDYTKENCRYIELSENRLRNRRWVKPGQSNPI